MHTIIAPRNSQHARWHHWLLASLVALFTATGAAAETVAATSTTGIPRYRVIQLSADRYTSFADVNARGQVALTEHDNGNHRARFYDGHTVRDLGTLGGPTARAIALNDLGQVTGDASVTADGSISHAYRWTQATGMVDLTSNMRRSSEGNDIDSQGRVAGTVHPAATLLPHAFFWNPQTGLLDIGVLDEYSRATAMNDKGTVVGYGGVYGPFTVRAFRWTRAEGIQDIGTIPSELTLASDVNNLGHVVGTTAFSTVPVTSNMHAFIWTPEKGLRDLGSGTGNRSTADRINEKDMVIGQVFEYLTFYHGFVWTRESGLLEIGANRRDIDTFVSDLNNHGQVVGGFGERAFIWTRGTGVVDLNTRLVGAPAGLVLTGGRAISDKGLIVATSNTGLVLLVPGTAAAQQAPVAGPIGLTGSPRVDALLSLSAGFTDVDRGDTHKATWTWGDGSTDTGIVSGKGGTGSVSGQHVFRAPGIYTVKLTLTDSSGKSSAVQRKVIVPGAGSHVSGEGSFVSPQGASRLAPRKAGVAGFAILASAGKAGGTPGTVRVEFNAPGLGLRSEQAEAQPTQDGQLQVRGSASVNGASGYRFLLMLKDRVRVRVWHQDADSKAELVDYDNLLDQRTTGSGSAGSTLTAGGVSVQAN